VVVQDDGEMQAFRVDPSLNDSAFIIEKRLLLQECRVKSRPAAIDGNESADG
jgi:hypothetical protein